VNARSSSLSLLFVMGVAGALACDDPVHDSEVSALGDEQGSPGPKHRPGQPCLTCHGGSGPAKEHFAVGGTIYAVKDQPQGLAGVDVQLTDSRGDVKHAISNDAGNFYLTADEWSPIAPIHVQISYLTVSAQMGTHIGRDGSCADCHFDPRGAGSPGRIYLVTDPGDLPGPGGGGP
jgi:hypothetical protein